MSSAAARCVALRAAELRHSTERCCLLARLTCSNRSGVMRPKAMHATTQRNKRRRCEATRGVEREASKRERRRSRENAAGRHDVNILATRNLLVCLNRRVGELMNGCVGTKLAT